MEGLKRKEELEIYEDKDTVTIIKDMDTSNEDNREIFDKNSKDFVDKDNWNSDAVATRIADLMMWTWKSITVDECKKILWDKIKDSKVLKNE